MRSHVYYALRKFISQNKRNQLKLVKYKVEKRLAKYRKTIYGTFNDEDLYQELSSKIPDEFDILMVHSSYSNMLPNYQGKLSDLLTLFKKLCGASRTLVMPAFFFGNHKYNYDVFRHYSEHGNFQVDKVPSQMGLLTEIFRRHPGIRLSAHPTHRISALGPMAEALTAGHEHCITGCGEGSPFDKMASLRTVIIGCGVRYYECMTQTHSPEDILIESGEYPTKFELNHVEVKLHWNNDKSFNHTLTLPNKHGYQRKLHPFLRKLLTEDELLEWKFHGVPFFCANAKSVQKALLSAARGGKSAYSLV